MSKLVSLVCSGATLRCPFGSTTSILNVTPEKGVDTQGNPAATIMDFKPIVNIRPFGMCRSLANPQVASATAAASGVLTPMPCIPVTSPWQPGSPNILIGNQIVLHKTSTCQCAWAGIIKIVDPGQVRVDVADNGGSGGGSGGSQNQQRSQEEQEQEKKEEKPAEEEKKNEQDEQASEDENQKDQEQEQNEQSESKQDGDDMKEDRMTNSCDS